MAWQEYCGLGDRRAARGRVVEGHIALQSRARGGLKLYEHLLPRGLLSARHHWSLNYCISIKIAALVLNPITRLLRSLPTLNWHQQRNGKQDSYPHPPPLVQRHTWQLCAQTGQGQTKFNWQWTLPKNARPQTTEISALDIKYNTQPDCSYSGDIVPGGRERGGNEPSEI